MSTYVGVNGISRGISSSSSGSSMKTISKVGYEYIPIVDIPLLSTLSFYTWNTISKYYDITPIPFSTILQQLNFTQTVPEGRIVTKYRLGVGYKYQITYSSYLKNFNGVSAGENGYDTFIAMALRTINTSDRLYGDVKFNIGCSIFSQESSFITKSDVYGLINQSSRTFSPTNPRYWTYASTHPYGETSANYYRLRYWEGDQTTRTATIEHMEDLYYVDSYDMRDHFSLGRLDSFICTAFQPSGATATNPLSRLYVESSRLGGGSRIDVTLNDIRFKIALEYEYIELT